MTSQELLLVRFSSVAQCLFDSYESVRSNMSVSPPGSDPPSPDGTVQSAVRAVAKFQAEMQASHQRQPAHSRAQGTPLRPAEPAERALHFDGAVKLMSGITSRQPAIPVLDHSPAMPIAQPAKSHLAARAASPLKPRTARIPMNPGSELATLPTLLDLQVDLRCMSRGALTARRDILEAELARVHTALADLDRLHAMQDAARTVAEQAAYSHSMATPAPGSAAVTARAAAVEGNVNSNSRSRGRSASGASAGWAPADSSGASQPHPGATSTPLSAQLRAIALRVITPPRTRPGASGGTSRAAAAVPHSTAGDLSDYRAHPASQAPSPNGATQQALEDMFWAAPPLHRLTAAGAAAQQPSYTSAPSYAYGAPPTSFSSPSTALPQPQRANFPAANAALPVARAATAAEGRFTVTASGYPTPARARNSTAAAAAAAAPAALDAQDFMYPAHHNSLLDELASLRQRRMSFSSN
jgi:hypothetical protein